MHAQSMNISGEHKSIFAPTLSCRYMHDAEEGLSKSVGESLGQSKMLLLMPHEIVKRKSNHLVL